MKIIRISIIAITSVFVLYVILALISPKYYKVERIKIISSPQNLVFREIADLTKWHNWSPYQEKVPFTKISYSGNAFTSGQSMIWAGDNKLIESGILKLDNVDGNKILYSLQILKPYPFNSSGEFSILINDFKTTKVRWTIEANIPLMRRPKFLFLDLEKTIGPEFEIGLTKLDSVCNVRYAEDLAKQFGGAYHNLQEK